MRGALYIAIAASLATDVVGQRHHHQHRHAKKRAADAIVKRSPNVVTEWVPGPTETVYELGGKEISHEEAEDGIQHGAFVVVGESEPSFVPPEQPEPTHAQHAQYEEKPSSSPETPANSPPEAGNGAVPTTSPPAPANNPGGKGLDASFPSGTVPCSTFPSDYGAIPIDYLNLGGWTGIQKTPGYHHGDAAINYIETGIGGGGCTPNSFCSYACPAGYQKTQWPASQGAKLESIGGLYCNDQGKLELSRQGKNTLCEQGAGGVSIQNDLDQVVSTCRTDYPGTESMTIPAVCNPGGKIPLTNPSSSDYYVWNNKPTTAQYYVNKKGVPVEHACLWDSPVDHDGSGNWAPVNIGVGKNAEGITYLSIFPNTPTSTAQLDFNIEITGDVSAPCALVNNVYTGGSNGCTVSWPRPIPPPRDVC